MYYIGSGHLGFATAGTQVAGFNSNNFGVGQNGNALELGSPTGVVNPCPVGTIVDFAGTSAPLGWFLCYGQQLLAASYPELFQVLGTIYGTSAGNVVLPDCRGRATYGIDNMGGSAAGRITVAGGNFDGRTPGAAGGAQNQTLTTPQIPSITPTFSGAAAVWGLSNAVVTGIQLTFNAGAGANGTVQTLTTSNVTTAFITPSGTISTFGGGLSHPILGPAIVFNKIIFAGRQ